MGRVLVTSCACCPCWGGEKPEVSPIPPFFPSFCFFSFVHFVFWGRFLFSLPFPPLFFFRRLRACAFPRFGNWEEGRTGKSRRSEWVKHLRGCTPSDGVGRSEPAVIPIVQPARSWHTPGCVLPFVHRVKKIQLWELFFVFRLLFPVLLAMLSFLASMFSSCVDLASFFWREGETLSASPLFLSCFCSSCAPCNCVESASFRIFWFLSAQMRGCALRT